MSVNFIINRKLFNDKSKLVTSKFDNVEERYFCLNKKIINFAPLNKRESCREKSKKQISDKYAYYKLKEHFF